MPKFRRLSPDDVQIGRGATAAAQRAVFIDAIRDAPAGRIDLERNDKPAIVKRRLGEAAKELGIKVRSAWTDDSQRTLLWKRTGL